MHRQAEDSTGCLLRFGEIAPFVPRTGESRLFVEAFRIINSGGHSFRFQVSGYPVPIRDTDGVLAVNMGVARHNFRDRTAVAEQIGVALSNSTPRLNLVLEMRELAEQDSRLESVEPAVHA